MVAPSSASTYTVCLEAAPSLVPATSTCHASRGVPRAYTTSRGVPTDVTVDSTSRAVVAALPAVSLGSSDRSPIGRVWATDVVSTVPRASVTTTKSPPITGRPSWVRS